MSKLAPLALILPFALACTGKQDSGSTVQVTPEPAGANCANGGQRIDVTSSGHTTTAYVCNGNGGSAVTATPEPAGANCAQGGVKLQVGTAAPTYICNGSELAWTTITSDTQAQPNFGYLAANPKDIVLTLPASAGLKVGDQLKVIADGAGGVAVTPAAGQSIQHRVELTRRWTAANSPLSGWNCIAASGDGSTAFAASSSGGLSNYGVYISRDFGANWGVTTLPALLASNRGSVAVSPDGTYLAVAGSEIDTSQDNGASWTQGNAPALAYSGIAMSSDGKKLVAVTSNEPSPPAGIYVSSDSGMTWTQTTAPNGYWTSVASSSDGTRLVATAGYDPTVSTAGVYLSTNSGATWTAARGTPEAWYSVASSADGTKIVAATLRVTSTTGPSYVGHIDVSTDSGATWHVTAAPDDYWYGVAMSADGNRLFAVGSGLYASGDFGETWSLIGPMDPGWIAIATSGDGSRLFAAGDPGIAGGIYTTDPTGPLFLHPSSALDLTYVGNGAFFAANVEGGVEGP